MTPVLALLLAVSAAPPPDSDPPAPSAAPLPPPQPAVPDRPWDLELGGAGRVGASAGHLLNVPWAFALPGGGANLKLKYDIRDSFYARGVVSVNLGVGETGTLGGSYRAQIGLGIAWLDIDWATFDTTAYIGLQSLSLIPIPGLGGELVLGLKPVRLQWLVWEAEVATGLDFLLIVPRVWVSASTGIYVPIGGWKIGAEVTGSAEAIVAIVANVVSATAVGRVYTSVAL